MDWASYLISNGKLIAIICDILTSIGTIGAVIVALYLAYRSNHPRPKIHAKTEFTFLHRNESPAGTDGIPVISVEIANQSIASINVNTFGWIFGISDRFWSRMVTYQNQNEIIPGTSSNLPIVIIFGQNIHFFIAEEDFLRIVTTSFPLDMKCSFLNRINAYFCYLFIQDSLGNFYFFRFKKDMRNRILNEIRRSKQIKE